MNNNSANLSSFCRSIGLIYDRTAPGAEPICSTFLIADKRTATLASLLLPFTSNPEALKVAFPSTEREFGVSKIHIHSKFDRTLTRKTLFQGTLGNGPEAALQKYNCCVLELSEKVGSVTDVQIEQVSQSLRYPINLSDDGFRGSLTEIELPLVIQTLNNAKKQGILYICDNLHRPVAQIYCQGGIVVAAKYRALMNEMAMFQIVEKKLSGRFIFRACKPPIWIPAQTITRSTDTILIEAMRRQDEINNLKKLLGTDDYFFVRAYKQLYLDGISPGYRRYVEMIWRALDGTTPADQLWSLVPLDDYTILTALQEMYASNQVMRVPLAGTMQFMAPKMPDDAYAPAFLNATPLPLGTTLPLNAFDTISSVSIDPATSRPRVKVGSLLGAIDPYDAVHLLHDIPLLPWASGSPLIKDDLVIGMHCGVVPNSSAVDNSLGVLQQMLWCEAIAQVIKDIPGAILPAPVPLAPKEETDTAANSSARAAATPATSANSNTLAANSSSASSGATPAAIDQSQFDSKKRRPLENAAAQPKGPPGCREIASLKCAICGERTFSSARRCMRCSNEFVPQLKRSNKTVKLDFALPAAVVLLLVLAASATYAWAHLPRPVFAQLDLMSVPSKPWLNLSIMKADPSKGWVMQANGKKFASSDTIHFKIKSAKSCYVYLLYKGTSSTNASLVYPSGDTSNQLSEGESFTYPERIEETRDGHLYLSGTRLGGPSGSEKIIGIASSPLGLNWLKDANNIAAAYDKADAALALDKSGSGLILSESQILPDSLTEKGARSRISAGGDAREMVFITSVTANH